VIRITRIEAEYIIEVFDEIIRWAEDQYESSGIVDQCLSAREIIAACLANDKLVAYNLEEDDGLDEGIREYLHVFNQEYPDITNDTDK
jgi:hypothetical protein